MAQKNLDPQPAPTLAELEALNETLQDLREEKELVSWEAPERLFKKRDKDFWVTTIAILVLVSVILIFVKEYFLIVALGSALFLYYVLSNTPPGKVKNKLTNRGIYFGELFYPWVDLNRFWFKTSTDYQTIHFETMLRFPSEVSLLFHGDQLKEKLKSITLKYLPLVEASPRFVDKASVWLAKKLPLENKPAKVAKP